MDLPGGLRAWWSAIRERRPEKHLEIQCDDSGVTLVPVQTSMEPQVRLAWVQITSVYAYKRDCVVVDQVRLVLRNDHQESSIEVTEDDIGFNVLIVELACRLPNFPGVYDWWDAVAHPAFETNWTKLYDRVAGPDRS